MKKISDKPVTVLLSSAGGYGYYYLKTLLEEFPEGAVSVKGIIDPFMDISVANVVPAQAGIQTSSQPERSPAYEDIRQRGIPVFNEINDFYRQGMTADLAVISSPLHYHILQSCIALQNGGNVLCEKPAGTTVQDVDRLIQVRNNTGRFVMVGYQWAFSEAVQKLKQDILKGMFGKAKRFRSICLWTRGDEYYNRNDWTGKIQDNRGKWILDSPLNNAMAHFQHLMLYLAGEEIHLSAEPEEIHAEVLRANLIENYDTIACRTKTKNGVELSGYFSHATERDIEPEITLEFEKSTIKFGGKLKGLTVTSGKLEGKSYGSPYNSHQFTKLFEAVKAVKEIVPVVCGPEAARPLTVCVNGVQESIKSGITVPKNKVIRDKKANRWYINGLDEIMRDCYSKSLLFTENGIAWVQKGNKVSLKDYTHFPGVV